MRIGIDLGNVIIGGDTEWFGADFLNAPAVEGAYDSVTKLFGVGHELFIVSKAYPRNQIKSNQWLAKNHFRWFNQNNMFFVLRREDKTIVCDHLKLGLMIDDRSDIIDHINEYSKDTKGYLFESWEEFWRNYARL